MLKGAGGDRMVFEAGTLNLTLLSVGEPEAVEEALGRLVVFAYL